MLPNYTRQNSISNSTVNFQNSSNFMQHHSMSPMLLGSAAETASTAPCQVQEWHSLVKEDQRKHIVQKIIANVCPFLKSDTSMTDPRIAKLLDFARKVEDTMFIQATSRMEYYELVVEKILKIKKELEEKRQQLQGSAVVEKSLSPITKECIDRILGLNTFGNISSASKSTDYSQSDNYQSLSNSAQQHEYQKSMVSREISSCPPSQEAAVSDSELISILALAGRIESSIFEQVTSKEEYHCFLKEMIYKIENNCKEPQQQINTAMNAASPICNQANKSEQPPFYPSNVIQIFPSEIPGIRSNPTSHGQILPTALVTSDNNVNFQLESAVPLSNNASSSDAISATLQQMLRAQEEVSSLAILDKSGGYPL